MKRNSSNSSRPSSPSSARTSSTSSPAKNKGAWNVYIVHFNIFLYAFAYWLTQPILPFLLKKMGAGTLSFGTFQSLFNLVQLFGGLVVGYLSDHYSASTTLSITQIGSACVYLSLFFATSMTSLYFSRVLTVIQQAMQVGQAIVSKSVKADDRAVQFGRLSLSYGLGMISGSFLSGRVNELVGNDSAAIVIAIVCSLLAVPVNTTLLDDSSLPVESSSAESKKKDDGDDKKNPSSKKTDENYLTLAFKLKAILIFLACLYSTRSFFEPLYSVLMINFYKVKQSQMGEYSSAFGMIGFVSNIILLPGLLKVMSEKNAMRLAIFLGCFGFASLSVLQPDDVRVFLGLFCVISLASSILYTLSTSYVTNNTKSEASGMAIALTHALRSGLGIFCPTLGTWMFEHNGGLERAGGAMAVVAGLNAVLLAVSAVLA